MFSIEVKSLQLYTEMNIIILQLSLVLLIDMQTEKKTEHRCSLFFLFHITFTLESMQLLFHEEQFKRLISLAVYFAYDRWFS